MKKQKRFSRYEEVNEDFATQKVNLSISLPSNFRMLCALFETSAEKILSDFMWNLSLMVNQTSDEQRNTAIEYFKLCGYGRQIYSEEEISLIFQELEAKRLLWPDIKDKVITNEQRDLHYIWSHMYMEYWFEKWYRKNRKVVRERPMEEW